MFHLLCFALEGFTRIRWPVWDKRCPWKSCKYCIMVMLSSRAPLKGERLGSTARFTNKAISMAFRFQYVKHLWAWNMCFESVLSQIGCQGESGTRRRNWKGWLSRKYLVFTYLDRLLVNMGSCQSFIWTRGFNITWLFTFLFRLNVLSSARYSEM